MFNLYNGNSLPLRQRFAACRPRFTLYLTSVDIIMYFIRLMYTTCISNQQHGSILSRLKFAYKKELEGLMREENNLPHKNVNRQAYGERGLRVEKGLAR